MAVTPTLRLLLLALAAILLYVGVGPLAWPAPSVDVALPDRIPLGANVDAVVTVHAWHANARLVRVRVVPDAAATTATLPGRTPRPFTALSRASRPTAPAWQLSRVTAPHDDEYPVALPFGLLGRQGLLRPGVLAGVVEVTVEHPVRGARAAGWRDMRVRETTIAVPFRLELLGAGTSSD